MNRNRVRDVLLFLTEQGYWRGHGLEPRHRYYDAFDWSEEQLNELPDDGIPEDLQMHEFDDNYDDEVLTQTDFCHWLHEGKFDLQVAKQIAHTWLLNPNNSDADTFVDCFDTLRGEILRKYLDEPEIDTELFTDNMSVSLLAKWIYDTQTLRFPITSQEAEDIQDEIAQIIRHEVASVRAYVSSWRACGTSERKPTQNIEEETVKNVAQAADVIYPWPEIHGEPLSIREDGRFAKAFPLTFPTGDGDLYQERMRSVDSAAEWVQHLFRFYTGHIISAKRGQREIWALFNTYLLQEAYKTAGLVHTKQREQILTKKQLRELVEQRAHVVSTVFSFGSDVPTTSMHWKRHGNHLEWIVRQMSWVAPWTDTARDRELDVTQHMRKTRLSSQNLTATASTQPLVAQPSPQYSATESLGSQPSPRTPTPPGEPRTPEPVIQETEGYVQYAEPTVGEGMICDDLPGICKSSDCSDDDILQLLDDVVRPDNSSDSCHDDTPQLIHDTQTGGYVQHTEPTVGESIVCDPSMHDLFGTDSSSDLSDNDIPQLVDDLDDEIRDLFGSWSYSDQQPNITTSVQSEPALDEIRDLFGSCSDSDQQPQITTSIQSEPALDEDDSAYLQKFQKMNNLEGTQTSIRRACPSSPASSFKHSEAEDEQDDDNPQMLWRKLPTLITPDHFGYGRNPAFWYTLNLPFNYLWEIHRFQDAVSKLTSVESIAQEDTYEHKISRSHDDPQAFRAAQDSRCEFVANNADIVSMIHALRVELLVRHVMSEIVPPDDAQPFQYWLRFEYGQSGNPHAHGQAYVAGNPNFDLVVADAETKEKLLNEGHPDAADLRTRDEAEDELADFFDEYVKETHPCKDSAGNPLYDFFIDNLTIPGLAKPQCVNLLDVLDRAFHKDKSADASATTGADEEPDFAELKQILVALIEDGQRHTYHSSNKPTLSVHACAREQTGSKEVYCRYCFPKDLFAPTEDKKGIITEDPHRKDLYNIFFARNDHLLNSFETHLLLGNLGNIDWRPLINLWSVLEYLTKYTAKAGKSSKKLGTLFADVVEKMLDFEQEDGIKDFWRKTVMKFYSRVVGDRDYSLFETVHFGMGLPGTLSSFGTVESKNVSNWSSFKRGHALRCLQEGDRATNLSPLELFNCRDSLKLPRTVTKDDLENLSFYSFWRIFNVTKDQVSRRRHEHIIAINGIGWPNEAAKTHKKHAEYARKTLYAYMPCYELQGTEYVDAAIEKYFDGDWPAALELFVSDPMNKWCPIWVRRNYEIMNPDSYAPTQKKLKQAIKENQRKRQKQAGPRSKRPVFNFAAEPPLNADSDDDTQQLPADPANPLPSQDKWNPDQLEPGQRHSRLGPNINPGTGVSAGPPPELDVLVNPMDHNWSESETGVRAEDTKTWWDKIKTEHDDYLDPKLSRNILHDDYQQLFVHMLLEHVKELVAAFQEKRQAEPMRLLLLGTAGTGKTRAIQTCLQEIKMYLYSLDLPLEFKQTFARAAAPTGTAAFNIRFHASTIHRLIHWFTPWVFTTLSSTSLDDFQKFMNSTQLIILDELSMIGRKMLARINSGLHQAKGGKNPMDYDLGGVSSVVGGDPAQCQAIGDQQIYDRTPHYLTKTEPHAQKVQLSNQGLAIYDTFEHVIVLTTCHRLETIENPTTPEERAFNDRADLFLQILHRLRDLTWTFADYTWLCKRKEGHILSFTEKQRFEDAPILKDFRQSTERNPEDNCEYYNRMRLRNHARAHNVPIVRFEAMHKGTTQAEGLKMNDDKFYGLSKE